MPVQDQFPDIIVQHQDPFRIGEGNDLEIVDGKIVDLFDDPVVAQRKVIFHDELTAMSNEAEDSEITNKATECIENLAPYTKKGGIAGVRANMLSAELAYVLKDYDSAISYYSAAISKGKKSYTAPICYYNIGSCYEELNKLSDAVEAYKTAAEFDEFGMAPHAYFSQGRVLEAIGDFTGAAEAYNTLKSKFPEDSWSNLATTRLIELQIQGKAE